MALGTLTLGGVSGTGSTSATTASFSPTGLSIVFASALARKSTGVPAQPTIDAMGGSWSAWTQIFDTQFDTGSNPRLRVRTWYATAPASPGSVAVSVDCSDSGQLNVVTAFITGASVDFSNKDDDTDTVGDASPVLPSSPITGSISYAIYFSNASNAVTEPSGFTSLADTATTNGRYALCYDPTPGTGAAFSSANLACIGQVIEIKEALVLKAVSDTLTIALTEGTSTLLSRLTVTDTLAIAITEGTVTLLSRSDVADELILSIDDISDLEMISEVYEIEVTDELTIAIDDTVSDLFVTLAVSDSLELSISEIMTIFAASSVEDELILGIDETAAVQASFTVTDTITIGLDEASSNLISSSVIDELTLTISESTSLLARSDVSDSLEIAISEARILESFSTVEDTLEISIDDQVDLVQFGIVEKVVSDELVIGITDAATVEMFEGDVTDGAYGWYPRKQPRPKPERYPVRVPAKIVRN